MAQFCSNCGSPIEDHAVFCTNCGKSVNNVQNNGAQYSNPTPNNGAQYNNNYAPNNGAQYSNPTPNNGAQYNNYAPNNPTYGNGAPMYVANKIPGRGFAIASLVLGILGLLFSLSAINTTYEWSYYSYWYTSEFEVGTVIAILIYSILSTLAVCFANVSKSRRYMGGIRKAGFILGIIGECLYVLAILIFFAG